MTPFNRKCFIVAVVFLAGACSSTRAAKYKDTSRALAASDTVNLNEAKILELLKAILKLKHQEIIPKYRIETFPFSYQSDLIANYNDDLSVPAILDEQWEILPFLHNRSEDEIQLILRQMQTLITANFDLKQRNELLEICFSLPLHAGDTLSETTLKSDVLCEHMGTFHTDSEVTEALTRFPAEPLSVRYDGNRGYHIYADKKLEQAVRVLVAAINYRRVSFYPIFHSLPKPLKNKFQKNKNSSDESAKVEPFDLLATYTTAFIVAKNSGRFGDEPISKIQVSKLVQKGLARLFHMMKPEDRELNKIPSLSVLRKKNSISVFCANGMFHSGSAQTSVNTVSGLAGSELWFRTSTGTDLLESWVPLLSLDQLVINGFSAAEFRCNLVDYRFLFRLIPAKGLPPPSPVHFSDNEDLFALMTVSLVQEIDRKALETAKQFAKTLTGWELEQDVQSVNTLEYMRESLRTADAYFPVMHSMDVNYFDVGTGTSLSVRLRKTVQGKNGKPRTLHLSILLPDGSSKLDSVELRPDDLAQILAERSRYKQNGLLLLNNSCGSEKTLPAWSLVFRKSAELRLKRGEIRSLQQATDFPHIIGSKRSFGAANLMEIFSHSRFPLRSFEMLGEDRSVADIVEFLKKPQEQTFIQGIASMFEKNVDFSQPGTSFDPVYIMEYPKMLAFGGVTISVTSRAIKGQDEY